MSAIERYEGTMDAIISCHNLEHCNEPSKVLKAMVAALKPGGILYLSFPCEESVHFPRRGGCLNFYDDTTHKEVPSWSNTLETLQGANCRIVFKRKRYRPYPLWLKGLFLEPLSAFRREVIPGGVTWALYGFESVIWCVSNESDVKLGDWGPRQTVVNTKVNLQPDGTSALWIQAKNIRTFGKVWVEFDNIRSRSPATVHKNLITSTIPDAVLSQTKNYNVRIVEASGRCTNVGTFSVRSRP